MNICMYCSLTNYTNNLILTNQTTNLNNWDKTTNFNDQFQNVLNKRNGKRPES